jgi:hypothetical protein
VMFRHGLSRAWESWLVKLAVIFGLFPALIHIAVVAIVAYMSRQGLALSEEGLEIPDHIARMLTYQLWLFASAVTLGAGASTLTEDAAFKTFPFYFAKPVTPVHYLIGRIGAVSAICAMLFLAPTILLVLIGAGLESPERRLPTIQLLVNVFGYVLIAAPTLGIASVGVSAIGRSRALTMSAWILLFVVPHVIATLLDVFIDWPWLKLVSIPSLLDVLETALFVKPDPDVVPDGVRWYHAVIVLVSLCAASVTFTLNRLRRAEVIA